MVCVGESVTLPDACELLVTVRDALPAVAVIVTDVALVDCHVRVTLCPLPIEVLLAENVSVGEPDPVFEIAWDPHPDNAVRRRTTEAKELIKQIARDFITEWPLVNSCKI